MEKIYLTDHEKAVLKAVASGQYAGVNSQYTDEELICYTDELKRKGLLYNANLSLTAGICNAELTNRGKVYVKTNPRLSNPPTNRTIVIISIMAAVISFCTLAVSVYAAFLR